MLRRIFGPDRKEVTGERRRLHNEDLYALYSPNIIWVIKSSLIRWARHVAYIWEMRGPYRVFVEKPEGSGPIGRPSRRWEDNIRMGLGEVEWGGGDMDWTDP